MYFPATPGPGHVAIAGGKARQMKKWKIRGVGRKREALRRAQHVKGQQRGWSEEWDGVGRQRQSPRVEWAGRPGRGRPERLEQAEEARAV